LMFSSGAYFVVFGFFCMFDLCISIRGFLQMLEDSWLSACI
jgi:hypothetical protein